MSRAGRWSSFVAAALVLLAVSCIVGTGVIVGRGDLADSVSAATLLLPAFFFCLIGALIVHLRPHNRMGWIFASIGFLSSTGSFADEYANVGTPGVDADIGLALASWYSEWFWIPFIFLTFCFSVLMFPSGSPPSPRWRPFVTLLTTMIGVLVVIAMLDPVVASSRGHDVVNPVGISGLADVDEEPFIYILAATVLGSAIAALASLIMRFRRSRGEERQQLKWFTYSAVVMVATFVFAAVVLDAIFRVRIPLLDTLAMAVLPIGAGIGILKYRLYDIDIIINRTLVYGVLSAVLVGAYAAGVLVFRTMLDPLTGDNDIAIAASTLAVAALFGPARRRIQVFIDKRFYRGRYDAQVTLEKFAARLRDEVDLAALESDLLDVVSDTVQPRHASLWLAREAR